MDKQEALKHFEDMEERLALSRALDLMVQADRYASPRGTDFMTPSRAVSFLPHLKMPGMAVHAFGGFGDAERQVLLFAPEWHMLQEEDYGISCLRVTPKRSAVWSHRDFLGAILGLGISREKIGDILVSQEYGLVFLKTDLCPFLLSHLTSVGREAVRCEEAPLSSAKSFERKTEEITGTVASLRLDTVLALAMRGSRNTALALIESGRVQINWVPVLKPDTHLSEGDLLSVKGFGRVRLLKIGGTSKKGRQFVTLLRYI